MIWKTEKLFDLDKIGKELLIKEIDIAIKKFKDNPSIQWTQRPMEKPLWEKLKIYVSKQIPMNFKKGERFVGGGYCPSCEIKLYGKAKYCGTCGQRLDWGELLDEEFEMVPEEDKYPYDPYYDDED